MKPKRDSLTFRQQGVMLLEALVAILIFSIGILAIVGLQANSIKLSNDAKYRSDASFLANQLIGEMWMAQSSVSFVTDFSSPDGTRYLAWRDQVASAIPVTGVSAPTVAITQSTVAAASSLSSTVDINIYWRVIGENGSGDTAHTFSTRTLINN
ncbi:MAG: type IV pilus modification protein PilV [Pseudomonadota bacterium]